MGRRQAVNFGRHHVCVCTCALIALLLFINRYSLQSLSESTRGQHQKQSRVLLLGPRSTSISSISSRVNDNNRSLSSGIGNSEAWTTTLKYFPQAERCQAGGWMHEYANLHKDISEGKRPGRWLISPGVKSGTADRLTGLVTLLWMAVLSQRAFMETTVFPPVASFDAACTGPFINWTALPNTVNLPPHAVKPFEEWYYVDWHYSWPNSYEGSAVNTSVYYPLRFASFLHPGPMYSEFFGKSNVSNFPAAAPGIPYLVANSNRGRSYLLASNPHHKAQFQRYGVAPVDAFMCGFFFLCSPTAAVQQRYKRFWDVLQEPGVLSIGIQIRTGDDTLKKQQKPEEGISLLKKYQSFFTCAQRIEATYAAAGQKVIWFLNSDSLALRQAAHQEFGARLLTETISPAVHIDCSNQFNRNLSRCDSTWADTAMQDAVGAMLTFSMTNYHIISKKSGFGKLPAWMSGRSQHLFEVSPGRNCNPKRPTVRDAKNSQEWSGV